MPAWCKKWDAPLAASERSEPKEICAILNGTGRSETCQLNPNCEGGKGSIGDPPVPSGQWPDGTERTLVLATNAWNSSCALHPSEWRVATRHRPVAYATRRKNHRYFGVRVKITPPLQSPHSRTAIQCGCGFAAAGLLDSIRGFPNPPREIEFNFVFMNTTMLWSILARSTPSK